MAVVHCMFTLFQVSAKCLNTLVLFIFISKVVSYLSYGLNHMRGVLFKCISGMRGFLFKCISGKATFP